MRYRSWAGLQWRSGADTRDSSATAARCRDPSALHNCRCRSYLGGGISAVRDGVNRFSWPDSDPGSDGLRERDRRVPGRPRGGASHCGAVHRSR